MTFANGYPPSHLTSSQLHTSLLCLPGGPPFPQTKTLLSVYTCFSIPFTCFRNSPKTKKARSVYSQAPPQPRSVPRQFPAPVSHPKKPRSKVIPPIPIPPRKSQNPAVIMVPKKTYIVYSLQSNAFLLVPWDPCMRCIGSKMTDSTPVCPLLRAEGVWCGGAVIVLLLM